MDSRDWWNRAYDGPMAVSGDESPSDFAIELTRQLGRRCKILELGCGSGQDSLHFAQAGHRAIATDFVCQSIAWTNCLHAAGDALSFLVLDMRDPFPFRDGALDVVYARLSLHYFSNAVTFGIFSEISRVLRNGGQLLFLCKSTNDPLHGRGDQVGHNMFRLNGKVRHFFDEAFARECLTDRFRLEQIWSGPGETYGEPSDIVKVRATRI